MKKNPQSRAIPDILLKIVETKKTEIAGTRREKPFFARKIKEIPPALDFEGALSGEGMSVIAEIKKASPSAGIISYHFRPLEIAMAYRKGGADAVSILTDETYFKGSIGIITLVRKVLRNIPVLRKDFIIDDSQIFETRAYGADTFLLIAGILSRQQLGEFILLGRELGMEPLVEVHSESELEDAVACGSHIIGVNNRNLRTFELNPSLSKKLVAKIPACSIAVSESGIKSPDDTAFLHSIGFNAVLVGETLMRSGKENCGRIISEFKQTT